tara:strand:+ start:518 stop:1051 length:534 start_codon:yes stop_codon:yes gene_type:complete
MKYIVFTLIFAFIMQFRIVSYSASIVEVYLIDQLDEERGYCIDIRGYKHRAKVNRGLQAHTCYSYQGGVAVDQGFDRSKIIKSEFFMPNFLVCMTASVLQKNFQLTLSKCDKNIKQMFKLGVDKKIRPTIAPKLCLTIAQGSPKKGGGGTPVHQIRTLRLDICSDQLSKFQIWGIRG